MKKVRIVNLRMEKHGMLTKKGGGTSYAKSKMERMTYRSRCTNWHTTST